MEKIKGKLIGLCGRQSAGKTTTTNHLVKNYNFIEISFAAPLKQIVHILSGISMKILLGDTSESRQLRETIYDPIWNLNGRQWLEIIGTDIFRNKFDSLTWAKIAARNIEKLLRKGQNVVVSDMRFPNELEILTKCAYKLGIKIEVWCIYRQPLDLILTKKDLKTHPAKWKFLEFCKSSNPNPNSQIRDKPFPYKLVYLNNEKDIFSLYKKIDSLLRCC